MENTSVARSPLSATARAVFCMAKNTPASAHAATMATAIPTSGRSGGITTGRVVPTLACVRAPTGIVSSFSTEQLLDPGTVGRPDRYFLAGGEHDERAP